MWDSSFKFLNKSIPIFSREQVVLKLKERKFIKIEAPFVDEISGLAIVKMLDSKEQCTVVLKLRFVRNQASLDVTDNMQESVIFEPNQMLGILDLRSLGYNKIKQGVLQQNLSKCYHFESAEKLCEKFNTLVNKLKKDEKTADKEKYPWLGDSNERKYMMDREICHVIIKDPVTYSFMLVRVIMYTFKPPVILRNTKKKNFLSPFVFIKDFYKVCLAYIYKLYLQWYCY